MCVASFAWNSHPRWRLLLAGNRDEFHARPAAALARWPQPPILAGRDLQAGGTWMAAAEDGRACVVTNVRCGTPVPHDGPSRGELPLAWLGGNEAARAGAEALLARAAAYAPFNLLLFDARDCCYLGNHPQPTLEVVERGVHAISNGALDAPWPKANRLADAMQALVGTAADDADAFAPLWEALADERAADDRQLPDTGVGIELERRLSPVFIRGRDYGTRASTLIAIDHDGRGFVHERRFGPDGIYLGQARLAIQPR